MTEDVTIFSPCAATLTKSLRFLRVKISISQRLSRNFSTTSGTAGCQYLASAFGSHAGTKTVAARSNQFARLISAFHLFSPVKMGLIPGY